MAQTTPFVLTQRKSTYPHDQMVNDTPVKTVSATFNGAHVAAYKGSAVALNDVTQLISIPAGAFVLSVAAKVTTVEGGTCTFDIGDGATVDGYLDGVDGNTSANVQSFTADTTEAFGAGKLYTAADTIDLKLISGTAAVLVVELSASYIQTLPLTA
jgi:hypothetical protein